MKEEIDALEKKMELGVLPHFIKKCIGYKWVYKIKLKSEQTKHDWLFWKILKWRKRILLKYLLSQKVSNHSDSLSCGSNRRMGNSLNRCA